jgi:hypothetical protein
VQPDRHWPRLRRRGRLPQPPRPHSRPTLPPSRMRGAGLGTARAQRDGRRGLGFEEGGAAHAAWRPTCTWFASGSAGLARCGWGRSLPFPALVRPSPPGPRFPTPPKPSARGSTAASPPRLRARPPALLRRWATRVALVPLLLRPAS